MKRTREQIKAELMKQAEREIDRLLDWEEKAARPTLTQFEEDGWLIGSGMVESGAKQFKDRFTGPGMRWSRPGAKRLLPVRAAVMSRTFGDAWHTIYTSPNN